MHPHIDSKFHPLEAVLTQQDGLNELRESVGMGVDEQITIDEAETTHAFEWQLPLSHQPLYDY